MERALERNKQAKETNDNIDSFIKVHPFPLALLYHMYDPGHLLFWAGPLREGEKCFFGTLRLTQRKLQKLHTTKENK